MIQRFMITSCRLRQDSEPIVYAHVRSEPLRVETLCARPLHNAQTLPPY